MLTGEFKFSLEFIETSRKQFLDRKNSAFSEEKIFPKFIYIHSGNPGHSQNSGACLPNERELFKERLMWANLEMSEDVEYITEHDENAIIIVAGDHGPYLTKNCAYTSDHYNLVNISRLDIQDRFGTFLAIKWSSPNFEAYDNIVILQDVFPSIFAYIFQNKVFLTAKIEPITLEPSAISGANVVDGVIEGGIHSGEPLFILGNEQ